MKRMLCGSVMLILFCGMSGCKGTTHESLAEEQMALMNEMFDVMEGVTDAASAQAAKPKLEKISTRMKELGEKAKALGQPSAEEEQRLKKKFEPELKKMMERFFPLMTKIGKFPELQEAMGKSMGGGNPMGGPGGPPIGPKK